MVHAQKIFLFFLLFSFCQGYGREISNEPAYLGPKVNSTQGIDQPIVFEEPIFSPLEQTSAMRLETICMVKCLEDIHYAHRKLKNLDFKQVLEEYIKHIDASRMLFLQNEIEDFVKRFASKLDVFLTGGSLTLGFSIFDLYRKKIRDRVEWVFRRIDKGDFDLYSDRTFLVDREKETFQKSREELEKLWIDRVNFEIVNEIILEETAERRKEREVIEALAEGKYRALFRFFKCFNKIDRLQKVLMLKSPKKTESKLRHQIGTSITSVLKNNSSIFEKRYIFSNVYRLHLDGVDVKLPLTLSEKVNFAEKNIKQRYKSLLRNIVQLEAWIVQEQFLNSVAQIYDPHTTFMSHESMEDLKTALHHSFVGIGAYLSDENGSCVIKELTPGGPAASSGEIKAGDRIIAVAQEGEEAVDVSGMILNKIIKLLRGKKNTKVFVTIRPAGDISEQKTVTLIRDEIELGDSRASAKIFDANLGDHSAKIGVISLPSFYGDNEKEAGHSNGATDVVSLIQKLKNKGIEGLVLDLRENGGGLLDQSVLIGGLFTKGPIVQVRGQYGNVDRFDTKSEKIHWDGPLIVLVSRMSASAAEILAGALKDHNRAIVVGDKNTHGKGTVQALLPIEQLFSKFKNKEDLGAAKITVQKWYRPSGVSIQIKGVESDIVFPSFDALLPIGEQDLPHAIEWDTIDGLKFSPSEGISLEKIEKLRQESLKRQSTLEEFQLLHTRIARLKKVVDTKSYSLNLSKRRSEKLEDENAQYEIDRQIRHLSQSKDSYEKVLLDAVDDLEKNRKTGKKNKEKDDAEGLDTHLRETLRIMADFLKFK